MRGSSDRPDEFDDRRENRETTLRGDRRGKCLRARLRSGSPAPDGGRAAGDRQPRVLDRRAGSGALSRADHQRDATVRQWGVITPSATVIGRADDADNDLSETVRRLHDEQHPATAGYAARAHQLDRLRTTQALCNTLEITPWQRDLALGVMAELDLTAFGSQRAIATVALVVIRHVVDLDRRRYFGLENLDVGSVSPERMDDLFARYRSADITDEAEFERLAAQHGLDKTSLNRLRRVLKGELDGDRPVYGRTPNRDPHLPRADRSADRG